MPASLMFPLGSLFDRILRFAIAIMLFIAPFIRTLEAVAHCIFVIFPMIYACPSANVLKNWDNWFPNFRKTIFHMWWDFIKWLAANYSIPDQFLQSSSKDSIGYICQFRTQFAIAQTRFWIQDTNNPRFPFPPKRSRPNSNGQRMSLSNFGVYILILRSGQFRDKAFEF